jgi:hypothetical protein
MATTFAANSCALAKLWPLAVTKSTSPNQFSLRRGNILAEDNHLLGPRRANKRGDARVGLPAHY